MSAVSMEVRDLVKAFPVEGTREVVRAVDKVNLSVKQGETLGLVGESGCGKTTIGRLMVRLLEPTSGQIVFEGQDVAHLAPGLMRRLRSKMQIIFQDPFSSLNPRMTVQTVIERPLMIHTRLSGRERLGRVDELMARVGLNPEQRARFPHEFSGGQRQRIAIARALAVEPSFVVLDEPTSALDVSVQAQILNLLKRLQQDGSLTYVFISHDLSVVRHMSDRIAVMYLGQIMEVAPKTTLFAAPLHPYTRALISAIPSTTLGAQRERIRLSGDVPSAIQIPSGCRFHTRCPFAIDRCRTEEPALRNLAAPGAPEHLARCHLAEASVN